MSKQYKFYVDINGSYISGRVDKDVSEYTDFIKISNAKKYIAHTPKESSIADTNECFLNKSFILYYCEITTTSIR